MSLRLRTAAWALVWTVLTGTAEAHSMRPVARDILVAHDDPRRVVALAEAAGVLASSDGATTFEFICSQSYAVDPYVEGVPEAALLNGGGLAIAAGTAGLRVTRDDGCQFSRPSDFDGKTVVDVTSPDGASLYVLSTEHFDALAVTSIVRSSDGGQTFTPVGAPSADAVASDLLVDASGKVFYVLERDGQTATSRLERSTDGGESFVAVPLPWTGADVRAHLVALWPEDARVFFVTTSRALPPTGEEYALYVTTDAGASFTRLATSNGRIVGPAFSPDRTEVAYGGYFGVVEADMADLLTSPVDATHPIMSGIALALGWDARGIIIGSGETILARVSRDTKARATSVLDICGLVPKTCAAGTTATQCGSSPHVTAELAALDLCRERPDAGAPVADSGSPPPPSPPSGNPDAGAPGADSGPSIATRSDSSGCAVRPARGREGSAGLVLCGLLVLEARRRASAGRRR
jgi:hypothetical protein